MTKDQTPPPMRDEPLSKSEIIFYQTEDGRTRIQCRFENETLWLSQALIAELFQKDVRTINEHLVNIFDEGELRREPTIRKFRIVRSEGGRQVAREVQKFQSDTERVLSVVLDQEAAKWFKPGRGQIFKGGVRGIKPD